MMFGQNTDDHGVGIVRTTAAKLLDKTSCPNGTIGPSGFCWPTGNVVNGSELNAFLSNPHLAVDARSSGTGAGDVYVVVTQNDASNSNPHIWLAAGRRGLKCGRGG